MCTDDYHVWQWGSSSTGVAETGFHDHLRCQCGQYTRRQFTDLRDENARLRADVVRLTSERDRLSGVVDGMEEQGERNRQEIERLTSALAASEAARERLVYALKGACEGRSGWYGLAFEPLAADEPAAPADAIRSGQAGSGEDQHGHE